MNVKFLKAGAGDAILIHHKNKNILIDGGNETSYLIRELNSIKNKGEFIDLLIITHHDDDHIAGIIDILKQVNEEIFGENKDFIKRVIFNSPRLIKGKITPSNDRLLSYKQAREVEELLIAIDTNWEGIITNESKPICFDDLSLTFLSPIKNDLDLYSEDKG